MNLKKYLVKIIAIILFSVFVVVQAYYTYAATTKTLGQPPKWIGVQRMYYEGDKAKIGYRLGGDKGQSNTATIWNVVYYENGGTDGHFNDDVTLYCIKAGKGFADASEKDSDKKEYKKVYDMEKERNKIRKEMLDYKEDTINSTKNKYNALLALLDRLYLNDSTNEEKEDLLNIISDNAGEDYTNEKDLFEKYPLTDSDIDATQQAAIWYFTNNNDNTYNNNVNKSNLLFYTEDDKSQSYKALGDYKNSGDSNGNEGKSRDAQTKILYNYLIKEALEHADEYKDSSSSTSGAPITINNGELTCEKSGENTIIGPIKATKNNERPYTIDIEIKKGEEDYTNYEIVKSNEEKNEKIDKNSLEDFIEQGIYLKIPTNEVNNLSVNIKVNYDERTMRLWTDENNQNQPIVEINREIKTEEKKFILKVEEEKPFDLALRKYITKLEDKDGNDKTIPNSRDTNNIVTDELKSGAKTTAEYKHRKDPVIVETGDKVTYNITIYNEGSKKGYASKVIDQLPEGLEYVENSLNSENYEVKEGGYDKATNRLTLARKDNAKEQPLNAYAGDTLAKETITIQCEVKAAADSNKSKVLTNVAWIAEAYDAEEGEKKVTKDDRDSQPETTPKIGNDEVNKDNMENYKGSSDDDDLTNNDYYYKGQQDDDDFEKLAIVPESFDLKLIKFITKVNNKNVPNRVESVDVSKLNTFANGQMVTTADYKLDKTPVLVKKGDIVTYTFRIYNEGTIDGYAEKITEDVPEGLQFMWSSNQGTALEGDATLTDAEKEAIKLNQDYLWGFEEDDMDENGKVTMVSTDFLSKNKNGLEGDSNLIKAFGENDGKKTEKDLHYKKIQIAFKVIAENASKDIIRNEAAITNDADSNGDSVDDRDSNTDIWGKDPSGDFYDEKKEWPKYKEDDEDYDNIMLKEFDLALRKFITKKENNVVDSRIPRPSYDSQNDKITYEHGKDPLTVVSGNTVEYTIRIFNEGTRDGYAAQVLDDIPDGLVFLPDNETNVEYRWVMYRKLKDGEDATKLKDNTIVQDGETYVKTDDPLEAEVIVTDYLSMEQNKDNLLKAFDKTADITDTNPDHKDVKVAFKVVEPNSSDRVIVNSAQISKDTDENGNEVEDKDSIPGEWNEGEDDQDKEYIELREFDLALRKWVTQAIVIENGKQTVTATGHQPWDDPEQVVKVEIVHSKLNSVTVKFRYSIRVINQGDIEGYAKEVTDYVPEGLKFVAEDNPGWTDEGNNVISTRLLENTLLKPGEYADVEVLLTWINSENGLGTVLTNTAEISEDYNEYGAPDKDSDPDNKKPGEDDIDDAPVILSIKTGQIRIYFTLGFVILITTACGIVLIKRYVI